MSIQSNINTMLSLAGVLASQSPQLIEMAKKREAVSRLTKQKEALGKATTLMAESGKSEIAQSYLDETANISKKIFETDPTDVTAESYLKDRYDSTEGIKERTISVPAEPEEIAQEMYEEELRQKEVDQYLEMYRNADKKTQEAETKAQEAVKVKQEEKRNTRRNFLDYMNDEPTSLGGTFKELDPALQKKIISQYSKAERKKIMDRKDTANG